MVIWEAEVRITPEEDCINYESEEILLLGKVWQFSSQMVRININVVLMIEKHLAINFAKINPISPFSL